MENAIIYARVSSKEQETEGYSIPSQLKLLKEYAAKKGYAIKQEFIDVETAKKTGRTQFNAMLRYIKENSSIKHILVEKTDRLLRNILDHALIDQLVQSSDMTLHLVKENIVLHRDSRSTEKFIFGIKGLVAKNYVDNLSEEAKKGMLEKAEQGIWPSCAPYGYINIGVNGRRAIAVDPQVGPFITRMFELYATGNYSLLALKKKMISEGMVYRNGKNFYKGTINKLLKNEFYTGVFYWRGKKYENASHEPLVSKEVFSRVQDILLKPNKSKSRKGIFTYTNFITCGVCGCAVSAQIQKDKYIYYHCSGYKGNCHQAYVREELIEAEFEKMIDNLYVSEDLQALILNGLRESLKDKIEYHNTCVARIERQVKVLQNRIDQAYLDKLDGKINEEFWQIQTRKWLDEKEALTMELLSFQRADTKYIEDINLIFELIKKATGTFKSETLEKKRGLLQLLVSNCTYKDGNLDIVLRSPFNKFAELSKTRNWRG